MSATWGSVQRSEYKTPDQIVRFEPLHLAYARIGQEWFRVASINGSGMVSVAFGVGKTEFAILRAFHLSHGQHEANSGRYDKHNYPDNNVAGLQLEPLTINEVLGVLD